MTRAAVVLVALLATAGAAPAQTPEMVKDINLGLDGGTGDPEEMPAFVEMGGAVYFQVTDGIHGTELWRSEQTGMSCGDRMAPRPGPCWSRSSTDLSTGCSRWPRRTVSSF